MKITEISVDRPITAIMIVCIVLVISTVSLMKLPIDLMPDVTFPNLSITISYPGATPEEIETLVSRPIEEALGSVQHVDEIETTSSEDQAMIRLQFEWGTNLDEAANDVRQRIDRMRGALPDDVEPPVMFKFDPNESPILRFGLASSQMDLPDLRYLAEHTLKQRIERIPGVASVEIGGGRLREIQVDLSQEKLEGLQLSPQTIVQAIRAENINLPAGEVYSGDTQLVMRTIGQFVKPDELKNIVVATRQGVPIYLRDVADVNDGLQELRSVERVNGVQGISLSIFRQSGGNTVNVADATQAEINQIAKEYPHIQIITLFDNAKFIRSAIDNVKSSAIIGSGLAIAILLVFLRNFRSTLIIATSIPVSVMASFALIYFSDFTLNIVSFGGLALGVGMLVDNSIVVLENIYRHREAGQSARAAAIDGTREVTTAIIASTLTTIVVFLPMFFLSGSASIMFTQLAYMVTFSLVVSLVVSLTLVPMLACQLLHVESLEKTPGESLAHKLFRVSENFFSVVETGYRRIIHHALRHRLAVVTISGILLAASIPIYGSLGFEYMPDADEGEVRVFGRMAPGTRLEAMDQAFTKLENDVMEKAGPYVEHVSTQYGASSWRRPGTNSGRVELRLKDRSERDRSSEEIAFSLNDTVSNIPGLNANARPSGGLFIFRMLEPEGENISVEVRGHDQETGLRLAEEVRQKLISIEGITSADLQRRDGRPEVGLEIDRYKAAEAGLTVTAIAQNIRTNFGGEIATRYREAGDEYDVRVRLKEDDRQAVSDLRTHWLTAPSGERVPASNFIRETRTTGPTEIERKDQQRVLTVTADLDPEYSLGNVMKEVETKLSTIDMPRDFTLYYGGEYEEQQRSFDELMIGLIMAVLLVYMVMAAQFESLIQPFVIMFSIPFGAIGVLGLMWATGTTMSVQAILGIIVLVGIAVNNAIVLVDYINMLRKEKGMALIEAIEEGGRRRLRPILMTTLTTVLALIPMAVGVGSGGELQAPMARVVFGGLTTSTLITLVIIPVIYATVEEALERRRKSRLQGQSGLVSIAK